MELSQQWNGIDVTLELRSQPQGSAASGPPAAIEIAALTRGLAAGDESAYRVFFDLYYNRLMRYLIVVTHGDEPAAREALAALFSRVTKHVRVFSDEAVFWSWLTVLARSALADENRKKRRYFGFLQRFTAFSQVTAEIVQADTEDTRLHQLLESAVTTLPEDERALIRAKYTERRSVDEIARLNQTTSKAVESRLSRVRRKLKQAVLTHLSHEIAD